MASDQDKTVWLKSPRPVRVQVEQGGTTHPGLRFTDTFRIGRDKSCQVQIKDPSVSRVHAEVRFDGETWWITDPGSANGIYVDGARIQEVRLSAPVFLELGRGGIVVGLTPEGTEISPPPSEVRPEEKAPSMTEVMNRYFVHSPGESAGEHTMVIRRAFQRLQKKQSRKYMSVIVLAAFLLVGAGGLVFYQNAKLNKIKRMSTDIFYNMKALELQVSQLETIVLAASNPRDRMEIARKRAQLKDMEKSYDRLLQELGLYNVKMTEEQKIIMRMARVFGECEINMPAGFVDKVHEYIQRWKSSERLRRAVLRSREKGYTLHISEVMLNQYLPPQFYYLALQESNFDERVVGPETRYGYAKGAWQFIPMTAVQYGLQTGPLVELHRYDPMDERHNFEKSTKAAARYLRDIYNTDAQASALLVMASYNWGEGNVREIIRRMPANPRERNFWRLVEQYRIPKETYDYVFYIFSAAVIGENPRLFGFDFDNPLKEK